MNFKPYTVPILIGIFLAVLVLPLTASTGRAEIVFENGFNFREFRVNPPLTFDQGPDLLVIGTDIIDAATGERPTGAIATARNVDTEETFPLFPFGSVGFSRSVTYTAERAAGNWIVEVSSDVGSEATLLPSFGTGPGTGIIPGVVDLDIVPSDEPFFSWVLPPDLPLLNDGNVDRIRLRIQDSNNVQILNQTVDDTDLTTTSAAVAPGIISHNGAYVGQVLLEGFDPFDRSRTYEVFVVEDVSGVGKEVVGSGFLFRDHRQENSTRFRPGDRLNIGGEFFPFQDTFVYAENGGLITPLSQVREADRRFEFANSLAFDASLTGAWRLVAWNGDEESIIPTNAAGDPELLPFVREIRIVPDFLTPTFEWELPSGNTVPFDVVQIGLFDDVTDDRLSVFGNNQDQLFDTLEQDTTSYKFKPGALEEGRKYVVRILLTDRDASGVTVNRSLSFFNFTPILETSAEPLYVPNVDESGTFSFDFDVTESDTFSTAVPVNTQPPIAVGYEYAVGEADPNFASVTLPTQGDNAYEVVALDDAGNSLAASSVQAEEILDFTDEVDPSGVSRFLVSEIEEPDASDQVDATVFTTALTFTGDGQFTGTIKPISVTPSTTVDLIEALKANVGRLVETGELEKEEGKDLKRILRAVLMSLGLDLTDNACRQLDRFREEVEDLIDEGELDTDAGSPLPLLDQAEAIRSSFGPGVCDAADQGSDDDDNDDDDDDDEDD